MGSDSAYIECKHFILQAAPSGKSIATKNFMHDQQKEREVIWTRPTLQWGGGEAYP